MKEAATRPSCLDCCNLPSGTNLLIPLHGDIRKNAGVSSPGLGFPNSQEESLGCSTKALARRPTEVTVDSADGINQLLFGACQYPYVGTVQQLLARELRGRYESLDQLFIRKTFPLEVK